jgi:hypothetical protein
MELDAVFVLFLGGHEHMNESPVCNGTCMYVLDEIEYIG